MNTPYRLLLLSFLIPLAADAEIPEEFRIKRVDTFEFAEPPTVRQADKGFTITFTTTANCDVTVAIENGEGNIVRHLASGVLGSNAPAPFKPDSFRQEIDWDGKDDRGSYIKDVTGHSVRVSLGLKPRFERTLFWSPRKRVSRGNRPLLAACEDGVLIFEGEGTDHLRLFDHEGNYVRTILPTPAKALPGLVGARTATFPQDDKQLPLKNGLVQATLLTSGRNVHQFGWAKYQPGATAIAIQGNRMALVAERLNRLSMDGTSGGLPLEGHETGFTINVRGNDYPVLPRSAAFSPDGEWLYMTGYGFAPKHPTPRHWLPCVTRLKFADTGAKTELFAGSLVIGGVGSQPGQFKAPTSVACDAKGRVYVSDYHNDRIQVFAPDGQHLKSIRTSKPARVQVHQTTGQIYVYSWMLLNRFSKPMDVSAPMLSILGTYESPEAPAVLKLPFTDHNPKVFMNRPAGFQYSAELDSWSKHSDIWVVPSALGSTSKLLMARGQMDRDASSACVRILKRKDNTLETKRDFGQEVIKNVSSSRPAIHSRQKLFVNPKSGKLYVFEGQAGVSKSCKDLIEVDPNTGKIETFKLPFDAEDLAFASDGTIYLRTDNIVGRFDPKTWREIPFDYGEERKSAGFSSSGDGRRRDLISAIVMPSQRPGYFHQGGMHISPRGHLVVSCYNVAPSINRKEMREIQKAAEISAGRAYTPKMFPGRRRFGEVHVWDDHGQVLYEDAVPGATMIDGVAIDNDDNVYLLHATNRILDGQPYFLERAETLIKIQPGKGKLISNRRDLPVPAGESVPPRSPDLSRSSDGNMWIEGSEWMYGGGGYGGFNSSKGGGGCACWHARFAFDSYARSFAPEVDHFSIAVIDTAGNLILRIGQYGNVDDGLPLEKDGGPPAPKSIGGDEVGLFHAAYVAIHSDRRLFISDGGNARILSVRLGYERTEKLPLNN